MLLSAWLVAVIAVVGSFLLLRLLSELRCRRFGLAGKHCVVTGGSMGIGKAVAKKCLSLGAHVTLVARKQEVLEAAKADLESSKRESTQQINLLPLDLSKDEQAVIEGFQKAAEPFGGIDVLVNCAGTSSSAEFVDTSSDEFVRLYAANVLTAVHATKATLPLMRPRGGGRICIISSQAGQTGIWGFSAYSASKFALRGFAEVLQMENKPYNIYVSVNFPPDTDTPGFEHENLTKPELTRLLSETSGLFKPDQVADAVLRGITRATFQSSVGIDGFMLSNLTAGMSPFNNLWEVTLQVLFASLFRFISLFYVADFDSRVKAYHVKQQQQQQQR